MTAGANHALFFDALLFGCDCLAETAGLLIISTSLSFDLTIIF
jgi:hypothetical protein